MTEEATVVLPDGRKITAVIPDGIEDPRSFVVNELTRRGMLGIPPLTTEQQAAVGAVPSRKIDPLSATFARAAGLEGTVPPGPAQLGAVAGIGGEGAGAGARARKEFAADPLQGARISLEKQFGQPVTVGQRPELQGRITFINPETGQEDFFNAPGPDIGDITSLAGPATVVTPEVVGGVLGAPAGPAGAIAGAGTGAGVGEAARLQIGRALGVNPDLSAGEQALSAFQEGGKAAAFDAAMLGAGAGARRIGGALPHVPSGVLDDIGGASLQEGLERSGRLQADFSETFGADLPLNTEQVLRDVAATQSRELRGATEIVRGRSPGEQLRTQRREQAGVMEGAAEQVLGPKDVSAVAGGRALQEQARLAPQAAIREQRKQVAAADEALQRQEQITTVQSIDAGAAIRDMIEEGRDTLGRRFDERYTQLREATGDIQVDMSPVNAAGRIALKDADAAIFKSLAPENRTILIDAIRAGKRKKTGLEFGPDGVLREVTGDEAVGVPFDVLQMALSDLRHERKLMGKNLSPRRNIKQVNDLIKALEDARAGAMSGKPGLAKQVANLESDFAAAKQRIDRGLIGKLVQPAEGGGFRLADDKVIPNILSNKDLSRKMADVLTDPAFQFAPGARSVVEDGLMSAMREASIDKTTGRMSKAAFDGFKSKNKSVLEAFFDPATMKRMNTLSGALAEAETRTIRMNRIVKDINKSFGMNLQKYDPSQVAARVFSGRAKDVPENLRRARVIASRSPAALGEWKKAVRAQLRRASTRSTSQEPGRLDFTALTNIAQNKEVVNELGTLMGKDWKQGFDVLVRALDTTRMAPTDAAAIQAMQAAGEPGAIVQGIARVVFPPLTREGRALTGALRVNKGSVVKSLDAILADPALLSQLKVLRGNKDKRAVLRVLEAIGLGHIAREVSDEETP